MADTRKKTAVLVTAAVICLAAAVTFTWPHKHRAPSWNRISCAMEIIPRDSAGTLPTGYVYELLKEYAADNGFEMDIRLAYRGHSYADSLRSGAIDLLAVAYRDSLEADSLLVSDPVDSVCLWLVSGDKEAELRHIDEWIGSYLSSDRYASTKQRFYDVFPYSKGTRKMPHANISPYDSLLRACSDSVGIDWHLLAAVMYGESRFNIQARSRSGAFGLMQLMAKPARKYGVKNLLDPEQNIRAGARILAAFLHKYRHVEDPRERIKFALAAYNAGEGKVRGYIEDARSRGLDTGRWEDVRSVIPMMNGGEIHPDSLGTASFKGKETYFYVDGILGLAARFRKIKP